MSAIRVLVVDDEESVVDVLRSLIGSDPSLELVGTAHDAERGIELALREQPDVVLMDVRMPGGGGLRAVREITKRCQVASVVALSAHEDEDTKIRMIGAGARDYVPKTESTDRILDAIHRSARNGRTASRRRRRSRLGPSERRREEQRARVEGALRSRSVTTSFQPIVDLETGSVVGVEAQPHVAVLPSRAFDAWAGEAERVGLLAKLELAALRSALSALPAMPEEVFMELEVSPMTAGLARFHGAIEEAAPRVVLAVSELSGPDVLGLASSLGVLREQGVRLTLADVGPGMEALEHFVGLRPEFVRLDRGLTDGVEGDAARHAIVAAVVAWATEGEAQVIAEGVTSAAQLEEIGRLGARFAQGDLLGPELHLADVVSRGIEPIRLPLQTREDRSDDEPPGDSFVEEQVREEDPA